MPSFLRSPRFWIIVALLVAVALTRLLPHPPNFAPIAALALFGAVYFRRKVFAFLLPMGALIFSDILLQITYNAGLQPNQGFHGIMPYVYMSFLLIVLIGFLLKNKVKIQTLLPATLGGSLVFFFVTNLGVFLVDQTFPRDLSGLMGCYAIAIPFLKNTVMGDLVYVTVLFGAFELVLNRFPQLGLEKI